MRNEANTHPGPPREMTRQVDYPGDHPGNPPAMRVRQGGDDVQIRYHYDANHRLTRATRQVLAVAAGPTGGDEHYASAPRPPSPWAGQALKGLGLATLRGTRAVSSFRTPASARPRSPTHPGCLCVSKGCQHDSLDGSSAAGRPGPAGLLPDAQTFDP